jgi:uracil-DNA glycosylase
MTKKQQLQELYAELEQAVPLPLAEAAADIVPGEGSAEAELLFIGEAPGEKEAQLRRPFVGRSGQLFRKTLQEVGFSDTDVYISNIAKARPPENRDPSPVEIAAYRPYLDREIEIISPDSDCNFRSVQHG